MRINLLGIILLLSFTLCGCAGAPHIIGYDVIKPTMPPPNLGKVYLASFADERPLQEREGVKGKLLSFSSKDAHFSKPVALAIKETLACELNNVGFVIVEEKQKTANYQIYGSLKHFQAVMSPAKITFLPYLGSVSTFWAKDNFTLALSIYIKMTDAQENILIDRVFDVSEDMKLPTGLLNLARYSRGFNYKLKLLDEGLKDVVAQVREEVVAKVKQ